MINEKKFGLIGYPLGHSLSQPIHEMLGCAYELFEFHPDDLEEKMPALRKLDGFNCTIPFKQRIMKHLDVIDERAQFYGAVNTVKNNDGKLYGYNTDWIGFNDALKGFADLKNSKILLVGAGGVSRMMAFESARAGAREIDILTRTPERAELLATELSTHSNVIVKVVDHNKSGKYDLILNGSPSGMWPETDGLPVEKAIIHKAGAVFDTIYNPTLTRLLLEAKIAKVPSKGGISMLVGQAAAAQKIWRDADYTCEELTNIENAMKAKLREDYKINIVLCGFMGSGKTYKGKLLAEKLGYRFVDLDRFVEEKSQMTIPELFSAEGETSFRLREVSGLHEVLGQSQGVVLALGGGTIIFDEAYELLKRLPVRIVFLDVSEEVMFLRVQGGEGRPMLAHKDAHEFTENARRLYRERFPRYSEAGHLIVNADIEADILVEEIVDMLFEEGGK